MVHIVADTAAATVTQANADMKALGASTPRFSFKPPVAHPTCTNMGTTVKLPLASVHVVYTTQGKPNPVTGKRAVLNVDRYYLAHGGGRVIVDLGTPQGVDNVDAYCADYCQLPMEVASLYREPRRPLLPRSRLRWSCWMCFGSIPAGRLRRSRCAGSRCRCCLARWSR